MFTAGLWSAFCFFFFQAEDGIRDYKVTGVQTCALPIYRSSAQGTRTLPCPPCGARDQPDGAVVRYPDRTRSCPSRSRTEIGRASCRERVKISVVAVSLNTKKCTSDETTTH